MPFCRDFLYEHTTAPLAHIRHWTLLASGIAVTELRPKAIITYDQVGDVVSFAGMAFQRFNFPLYQGFIQSEISLLKEFVHTEVLFGITLEEMGVKFTEDMDDVVEAALKGPEEQPVDGVERVAWRSVAWCVSTVGSGLPPPHLMVFSWRSSTT